VVESAIPRGRLAEIVREARARTRVPGVAAGLAVGGETELAADGVLALGSDERVNAETPFRVASVTKLVTASLAALCLDLDAPLAIGASPRRLLSHTAGLRPERAEPLPEAAQGLWSYSNAGYWAVGEACAAACGSPFGDAVRGRLLESLGMTSSGFAEPSAPARGHASAGLGRHRALADDSYPAARHASGGLWSTVGDLLRFAAHQLGGPGPLSDAQRAALHEPQADALGARYALGCWTRRLAGGRTAHDHDGSVAGYQSLLLVVPEEQAALAVLTNSARGSTLIRRVVLELGLVPETGSAHAGDAEPGRFALDGEDAAVTVRGDKVRVATSSIDPVTGARTRMPAMRVDPLGGGVYGFGGGLVMGHRLDFPRRGVARVGWVALPRAAA
jgi:CubicO group peptidase (beta-lactamase class C family)